MKIYSRYDKTTIIFDKEIANLREADLREANLRGADLREVNLRGVNLRGTNLRGADLRGADLREVNLCGANLCGADLREANLCGADLYGANLRGTNLCGADLRGADLSIIKNYKFPIQIFGHRHQLQTTWNGKLQIGCLCYEIDYWLETLDSIGEREGYSLCDCKIYRTHIEHIKKISEYLWKTNAKE